MIGSNKLFRRGVMGPEQHASLLAAGGGEVSRSNYFYPGARGEMISAFFQLVQQNYLPGIENNL